MKFLDAYLGPWIWFSERLTPCEAAQNADGRWALPSAAPLHDSIQLFDNLLAETVFTSFVRHKRPKQRPAIIHTEKQS